MLHRYKGRELKKGQKVMVYFNLHTHLFSIKDSKMGKVVAHGNNIILEDATFKVNEAGRQRVIKEGRKNVHAYVVGRFAGTSDSLPFPLKEAYYNPVKVRTFIDKETGRELCRARIAFLKDKKVFFLV